MPIWLRSLSFLVIAPGSILGLLPWWVTDGRLRPPRGIHAPQVAAVIIMAVGVSVLLWCFRDFARRGQGTPAPYDPPKLLVVAGLYRFTRNPMYVGLVVTLLGESLWSESWRLLVYAGVVAVAFHLRVLSYEEPKLTKLFGEQFEAYRARVPRWVPRLRVTQSDSARRRA